MFLYKFSFKFWESTKNVSGFYIINYIKYIKDLNKKTFKLKISGNLQILRIEIIYKIKVQFFSLSQDFFY